MVTSHIRQAAKLRRTLARLERRIARRLPIELAELPAQYGYATAGEFIAALESTAGNRRPRRSRAGGRKAVARKVRKRAVITAAVRARVKKLVKTGKSGLAIAKAVGISLPSVQNIKKALGLVKSRRSKSRRAPAKRRPSKKVAAPKARARKVPARKGPPAPPPPAPEAPKTE
jgi:hypothetical protein